MSARKVSGACLCRPYFFSAAAGKSRRFQVRITEAPAAIAAGASVILTWNLRDFPAAALKKYGLHRQAPDTFLADIYDQTPDLAVGSLANARRNLNKSRVSA